jgi:hypothetical protein
VRSILVVLVLIVADVTSAACEVNAPAEGVPAARSPGRAAQIVNATILANGCQEFGPADGKLAEKAMYDLVEGCTSVPGGVAQFGATLLPGGHIDITGAPGQPDVVPICILKHALAHTVPLAKPCRLDVKIEQSSVHVRDREKSEK